MTAEQKCQAEGNKLTLDYGTPWEKNYSDRLEKAAQSVNSNYIGGVRIEAGMYKSRSGAISEDERSKFEEVALASKLIGITAPSKLFGNRWLSFVEELKDGNLEPALKDFFKFAGFPTAIYGPEPLLLAAQRALQVFKRDLIKDSPMGGRVHRTAFLVFQRFFRFFIRASFSPSEDRPSLKDAEMERQIAGRWKGSHKTRGVEVNMEMLFLPSGVVELKSNAVIKSVPRHAETKGNWRIRKGHLKCFFRGDSEPEIDSKIILLSDKELKTQQRDSVGTMYRQC